MTTEWLSVSCSCLLTKRETDVAVADAEARLEALHMMKGLWVAANAVHRSRGASKGWFYHLIILNSEERRVQINAYDQDGFERAVADYERVEAQAAEGA